MNKKLVLGALLLGTSAFIVKKRYEQKQHSTNETDELVALGNDWLEKKEQVLQSVQQLKKNSDTYLQPFLDETNQLLTNFNFQTAPRVKQITDQTDKIVSELTKKQ